MTNRSMVKPEAAKAETPDARRARAEWAERGPDRPMPAPESDLRATTDSEPMDSPQPKPQFQQGRAGKLTTGRG